MATWLTHLRIAEKVSAQINISDRSLFFAGSIAPDSDMPSDISHWCVNGDKTTCDVHGFYINCISDSLHVEDKDFYWGYYVHLLTDILWHEQKIMRLKHESKAAIKAIKQKWRTADIGFLSDNRNFKPLIEMKYAMEYTSKYDKQRLDIIQPTKLRSWLVVSSAPLILRKQRSKAGTLSWKQKLSSLLMSVQNSLL